MTRGERFRELRLEKGWSLRETAQKFQEFGAHFSTPQALCDKEKGTRAITDHDLQVSTQVFELPLWAIVMHIKEPQPTMAAGEGELTAEAVLELSREMLGVTLAVHPSLQQRGVSVSAEILTRYRVSIPVMTIADCKPGTWAVLPCVSY